MKLIQARKMRNKIAFPPAGKACQRDGFRAEQNPDRFKMACEVSRITQGCERAPHISTRMPVNTARHSGSEERRIF